MRLFLRSDRNGVFRAERDCDSNEAFFLAEGVRVRLLRREGVAAQKYVDRSLLLLLYEGGNGKLSVSVRVLVLAMVGDDGCCSR